MQGSAKFVDTEVPGDVILKHIFETDERRMFRV